MSPSQLGRAILLLIGVFTAPHCRGSAQSSTDGETHFLMACEDAGECGSSLSCLCGVCALPCANDNECGSLGESAECVDEADLEACVAPSSTAMCDVRCSATNDCTTLGADFRCVAGFCRIAGGPGTAGSGGSSGGTGAGGEGGSDACPSMQLSGDQVVVLGDVFVAQTHEIPAELVRLAREAGTLSSTESYRDYSSTTQNSLTLNGALLTTQFAAALDESPVEVVVMNGGGTDMLVRSCDEPPSPTCALMQEAVDGATQLLSEMATAGVGDVVWFFYPDPTDEELLAELHVLSPLLQTVCRESMVPCHWVELQPTFAGHLGDYLGSDFVPTTEGARAAAARIWGTMQAECIAQ